MLCLMTMSDDDQTFVCVMQNKPKEIYLCANGDHKTSSLLLYRVITFLLSFFSSNKTNTTYTTRILLIHSYPIPYTLISHTQDIISMYYLSFSSTATTAETMLQQSPNSKGPFLLSLIGMVAFMAWLTVHSLIYILYYFHLKKRRNLNQRFDTLVKSSAPVTQKSLIVIGSLMTIIIVST